jgi:hypothetical protein
MDGHRGIQTSLDGANAGNVMSRAEKFEDEKRRIIESCFAKKGPDGNTCKTHPDLRRSHSPR